MKNEQFDPRMEFWKVIIGFFGKTADMLVKQGPAVALSVCGCIVFLGMMDSQKREMKAEILDVKRDCSNALNEARRESAVMLERAQGEIDVCHAERERLAVRVAGLEVIVQQLKRKR